jgi:general L-amino acid transport system substrate-binding protein
MSLMPKPLPKNAANLTSQLKNNSTKIPLRQWCFFASLTIALLSGCQEQPKPNPTATPAPIATPTAAAIDKDPEGILERVKARGKLICGVNGKLTGFSYVDDKGLWSGLDVDYCKAIAAAVLGDAKAVEFKPLLAKDRFTSVQNGDVDILMRNTTRTLTRDVVPNISFAPTTFFDGQGVMVRIGAKPNSPSSSPSPTSSASSTPTASPSASPSPTSTPESRSDKDSKSNQQTPKTSEEVAIALKDLSGKKICVETGLSATNLAYTFKEVNIAIESIVLPDLDGVLSAYAKGDCEAISSEKSQLAAWRSKLPRPADHKILDLSLSKEPLSPMLIGNDDHWRDVVTWVFMPLFMPKNWGLTWIITRLLRILKILKFPDFLGHQNH